MPGEINPSALTQATTPQSKHLALASGAAGDPAGSGQKPKVAFSAPRIDVEPIYAALKAAVGDNWSAYKDAICLFVLGTLNLSELARRIDSFISIDPSREHLHNQLITAIHINVYRDAPDQTVASWVSANDKPASVTKQLSGDAFEARLKHEIMQLPPRTRHRLKGITDEPANTLRESMLGPRQAKHIPTSMHLTASASAQAAAAAAQAAASSSSNPGAAVAAAAAPAGGNAPTADSSTGLNKDADIRRRFAQPLIGETRDLPKQASSLADRLLSLSFELGLNGSTQSTAQTCAEYLGIGLEAFIKEELSTIISRTRTDAPVSVPIPGADAGPGFDRSKASAMADGLDTSIQTSPTTNSLPVMGLGGSGATGLIVNGVTPYGAGGGILTSRYKQRLIEEDKRAQQGLLKRSELGLLPVEHESLATLPDKAGTVGDLRMAWEMGDTWMSSMMPWVSERVALQQDFSTFFDPPSDIVYPSDIVAQFARPRTANGDTPGAHPPSSSSSSSSLATVPPGAPPAAMSAALTDGAISKPIHVAFEDGIADPMIVDEDEDWAWEGADRTDRDTLGSLLDGCLAVGR